MLVPLQGTLPGWPVAEPPSALEALGLLIGLPLGILLVIGLLGKAGQLIRAGRGETTEEPGDPIWLGARPVDRTDPDAGDAAVASQQGRRAVTSSQSEEQSVGGVSVRW